MASPRLRITIILCLFVAVLLPTSLSMGIPSQSLEEEKQVSESDDSILPKYPIVPDVAEYASNEVLDNTWSGSIKRAMSGPTGQMVVHIAKEVISRQVGGSQVLSLNLTNLLILLFLKAIIFAAGLIGAGSWGQFARSLDNNARPVIDFGDASMMMGFLAAQGSGHNTCLYRAACEYPRAGLEYSQAGQATLTGMDIFSRRTSNRQYEKMISGIEKAAKEGLHNAPCSLLYKCDL